MKFQKGLSPLIAVVLVIAFTLAVAGIVSTWITTFAREESDQLSDTGSNTIDCTEASLFFNSDDVAINKSSSNNLIVSITNEGDVNLTDFEVSYRQDDGALNSTEGATNNDTVLKPGGRMSLTWSSYENTSTIENVRVATGPDATCSGISWNVDL